MKSEKKIQIEMLLRLLCVCVFALMYAWGGMEFKFIRRFIAPTWLALAMFYFSRRPIVFLQGALMMGSLSLGYGADVFWQKVLRRLIFGAANAVTAGVHFFTIPKKTFFFVLFILNAIFIISTCVGLGVFNPLHARAEELMIGFVIGMVSMFMPTRKEDKA